MSDPVKKQAALYIVATPIGNLGDMTGRAVEIMKMVDLIAAEDTRHSGRLLQHFGVATRMTSYHDFSDETRVDDLIGKLSGGLSIALISDAGTPLISDPGYRLVVRARQAGIPVIPIPGACALTTALSAAGLPSDRFVFEGFPSAKRVARLKQFEGLLKEVRTLIFYESPHRILDCVQDLHAVFGSDREVVLCRELTKTFESIHGDTLGNLLPWLQQDDNRQRGEFVVLVKGAEENPVQELDGDAERVLDILLEELSTKQAAAMAARITGVKKNLLYQRALSRME
ncbi:MAG: 16S rRNA (cytidine(1402)-2'-O)-methyltransferase [Gammaproteobacteria bacterium]|nr:16S rRNA (cytidine(1402)-2'-O)-methyltransferase [Gammaproteobacteria bacterium]MDP2140192.1 16S rRNA (cytidine(1402)-2'-O)-methyltransferase [Gammaproteobacteria bacterium]MDP2348068.1 16S rRNA (cytidine(1402)-2'-O)-methyltransferase [Gammaproteobacteria bacterium]